MTYRIDLTAAARRSMARLPAPVALAALKLMRGALAANPQWMGKRLLPPFEGEHRARRGAYRVRYRISDDVVTVVDVQHRRDAYP